MQILSEMFFLEQSPCFLRFLAGIGIISSQKGLVQRSNQAPLRGYDRSVLLTLQPGAIIQGRGKNKRMPRGWFS